MKIFKYLIIIVALASCDKNRLKIDVSKVDIKAIKIERMEQELFGANPDNLSVVSPQLYSKYGAFYARYVSNIVGRGGVSDSTVLFNLKQFITDKDMSQIYSTIKSLYPNLNETENQLTKAFKHYKFYFPDKNIPKVVTVISALNYSVAASDSTLGIGLDMYMGQKNKIYDMTEFPMYKRRIMEKEFIACDAMKGWITSEFNDMPMGKGDFLSQAIGFGKIMYLLDATMPETADSIKIGFTQKQLDWCKKNEENMWKYFIENKILFSTDPSEYSKFFTDGPFTASFKGDSPARVGYWVGWQIVRNFMSNNPDITINKLIEELDAQKILNKSKYKP